MKKMILLFLIATSLNAQTGAGSGASAKTSSSNGWQNWVFVGTAVVTAATGVVILAFNNGHPVHAH